MSDSTTQQIEEQSLDSNNTTPLNLNKQDSTSFPLPNDQEESKTPSANSQQQEASQIQQKSDQEVSKESLLITLKTQSAELKKMELFKKKLEDRFKEKVKQAKDLQKEKSIMADFIMYAIPAIKVPNVFDKEGKLLMDLDTLIRTHAELQAVQLQELSQMNNMGSGKQQQQKQNSDELLPLFKEENENLKRKIVDLTTMYKQEQQKVQSLQATAVSGKLKDAEKKIEGLEDLIREKEDQLNSLRQISNEFTEMKGKQLLQVIKATKSNDSSQTLTTEVEEIQTLKQQLSDKTNKILELNEKLQLANQTIQAIEESNNLKQNQFISDQLNEDNSSKNGYSEKRQSETNLKSYSVNNDFVDESLDEVVILKSRCAEFEQIKNELLEQIEQNKLKARNLLIKKDVQISKIKLVISKLESYLRTQANLTQEEIFKIGQLKDDEIHRLQELEKDLELEDPINEWDESPSISLTQSLTNQSLTGRSIDNSSLLKSIDNQIYKNRASIVATDATASNQINNVEYIKNVFVKYLEYLAQNSMKQIGPMESILFTMLNVSKDEIQRLQLLRSQNTFWKKVLPFQANLQPLVKNKFSADELKKKLFGGVKNFMTRDAGLNLSTISGGMSSNRPSLIKPQGEVFSQRGGNTVNIFNTVSGNEIHSNIDFKTALGNNTSPRSLEEVKVNKLN
eukprot:403344969